MTLRNAVKTLLVLVLALPMVAAVLVWVDALLRAMGDAAGATVIGYVGIACQIAWTMCLVGLLVVLTLTVLGGDRPTRGQEESD